MRAALSGDRNLCSTLMVAVRLRICRQHSGSCLSSAKVTPKPPQTPPYPLPPYPLPPYLVRCPSRQQHRIPRALQQRITAHPALLPQPLPQLCMQVGGGQLQRCISCIPGPQRLQEIPKARRVLGAEDVP